MKTIDAYRVTVTQSYRMDEQGTGYSLQPWQGDGRYYDGDCQPAKLSVPDDTEIIDSPEYPDWLLIGGQAYHLSEAIGLRLVKPLRGA